MSSTGSATVWGKDRGGRERREGGKEERREREREREREEKAREW